MSASAPAVKAIDPCALASLTTGILLCESGFGAVAEAAEWVLGHPVWTHEFIDPTIKAALITGVLAQFPDMPTGDLADWRATAADLRARYGAAVDVIRGTGARDRDPLASLEAVLGERARNIIVVEASDAS